MTLFELFVTMLLLGTVFVTLVPVVRWAAQERRAAAQYHMGLREADNVLERLASRPWEEITGESAAALELSEEARRHLRDAELRVAVDEPADTAAGKRIRVEVQWTDAAGTSIAPVRLTTWVHQRPAVAEGE